MPIRATGQTVTADLSMSACRSLIPFHTYLWKIASRCNLNCTYCYVYNLEDQRWRKQPPFMSEPIARQVTLRMLEHCKANEKNDLSVVYHGGEPLLGGVEHLDMLNSVILETLVDSGIKISLGMQSNGLLFTREIGEFMLKWGMSIGISIDGPPAVNDLYRVDHRGRPSSAKLEKQLLLLSSPPYNSIFSGFLCVINPRTNPEQVIDYLLSFNPPSIDFLFP